VLAEPRRRILYLAVDGEVHEVLELRAVQPGGDEAELERRLLDPLGEVQLVEREAQLPVLEHVIRAR
jgi:hypothetical protein